MSSELIDSIFREGEKAPHFVQIARVLAAEAISGLEADLGRPLAKEGEEL
jgi:hypothetical protein